MKNFVYIIAFVSVVLVATSCGENDSALGSDYTDLNVPAESIDGLIIGQWKKYTVTRTTYFDGREMVEQLGTYNGIYRFEAPPGIWNNFNSYEFPYSGMFEVRRYGERLAFYQRSSDQHMNLMLEEVTSAKVVMSQSQLMGKDYFVVVRYTLTK